MGHVSVCKAAKTSSGRWLAIDDALHDAHPSWIESQSNVADDAFRFLKFDHKASHHERIVRALAFLA